MFSISCSRFLFCYVSPALGRAFNMKQLHKNIFLGFCRYDQCMWHRCLLLPRAKLCFWLQSQFNLGEIDRMWLWLTSLPKLSLRLILLGSFRCKFCPWKPYEGCWAPVCSHSQESPRAFGWVFRAGIQKSRLWVSWGWVILAAAERADVVSFVGFRRSLIWGKDHSFLFVRK